MRMDTTDRTEPLKSHFSKSKMATLHILPNKTANIILNTKLESFPLSYESHRSKTANIKILFANSKHRS